MRKRIIEGFAQEDTPKTYEEYCRHYRGLEYLPFAKSNSPRATAMQRKHSCFIWET